MSKPSKRFTQIRNEVDHRSLYSIEETVAMVKRLATAGFDETIEVAVALGVDPKYSDQMVRGTCMLPNGTGKKVTVLVFARGDKAEEASAAGADHVGDEDLAEKIKEGWVLGPRGLMPNPKVGTVTADVTTAVTEAKAGKISFRVDKTGNLHVPVGKASFDEKAIGENLLAFMEKVIQLRPGSAKGRYLKSVSVSSTMGPGIRVDINDIRALLRQGVR
jgi:large subunit ribosomal protein L1